MSPSYNHRIFHLTFKKYMKIFIYFNNSIPLIEMSAILLRSFSIFWTISQNLNGDISVYLNEGTEILLLFYTFFSNVPSCGLLL